MVTVGILGCGSMGGALMEGWLKYAETLSLKLYDRHLDKLKSHLQAVTLSNPLIQSGQKTAVICQSLEELIEGTDVLVLCIKPKEASVVIEKLKPLFIRKGAVRILVSAVAGLSLDFLRSRLREVPIVRVMPNLAVRSGKSYISLFTVSSCQAKVQAELDALFKPLGLCVWARDEAHLEAAMALSSCGLAFMSVLMESWADAGIFMGLTSDEALEAACQTVLGYVSLLKDCEKHPASLKWEVTSPAGATIAGLRHLEREGLRGIWMDALLAAKNRFGASPQSGDSSGGNI
jgi:pyrroline-5-carboxylate reductase